MRINSINNSIRFGYGLHWTKLGKSMVEPEIKKKNNSLEHKHDFDSENLDKLLTIANKDVTIAKEKLKKGRFAPKGFAYLRVKKPKTEKMVRIKALARNPKETISKALGEDEFFLEEVGYDNFLKALKEYRLWRDECADLYDDEEALEMLPQAFCPDEFGLKE